MSIELTGTVLWKMELSANDDDSRHTHVRRICMRFIRWRVAFKLELVKLPNVEIHFVSNTSSHNATGLFSGSDVTKNDKSKNRFENQQVQIACILKCPFAIWIYFNIQNWEERERAHFAYIPYDNYSNRLYQFEETKEGSKENGWMDGWTEVLVGRSVDRMIFKIDAHIKRTMQKRTDVDLMFGVQCT